jgi:hypothetical protein
MGLKVLITNLLLHGQTGTETVVRLLADGLRAAGHQPMVFAFRVGPQARQMQADGHVVVNRIAWLPERPDVIHAQHGPAAIVALAAFPDVPVVYASHGAYAMIETPVPHPQIRRVIAVDDLVAQRCLEVGIAPDRLRVILNAVDTGRFRRRARLPRRPRKALLLTKNSGHRAAVRAACDAAGLALDELGPGTARISDQLEVELPRYDLVIATARMALEAAVVGCAVVVADERGFAGMLTADRLDAWRRLNLGIGLLSQAVTPELLGAAIAEYDAADAALVTDRLRAEATAPQAIAAHVAVYQEAIAAPAPSAGDCAIATAAWLEDMLPTPTSGAWRRLEREVLTILGEAPSE